MRDSETTSGTPPHVIVVGAGINGLGIAWRLAQAGCAVDVYDKEEPGRGASWAAAGMLAANAEAEPGEAELVQLGRMSQEAWPAFASELAEAGGIDPEYRETGLIVAAMNRDEADKLRFDFEFQQSLGLDTYWLKPSDVHRYEPHLRRGVTAGIWSPQDHQVDNRRLVQGLQCAAERAGVRIHGKTPVQALAIDGEAVKGIYVADELVRGDKVIVTAGPWTGEIAGLPDHARPPVRPIKGQMLALRMDQTHPLVQHVLWAPTAYLVPRRDGRLLVGGTVEEKGFDTTMTAGGVYALLEAAWRAIPAVEDLPIDEMWVGFRPGSRDDAPILGPTPIDGLWLATGHHRNGVLLAPLTANLMSEAILSDKPASALEPFSLARFTR